MRQIDGETPKDLDLRLILDNSSIRKTPKVKAWLGQPSVVQLVFHATSTPWLNAIEGWFGQLEQRAFCRGMLTNVGELKSAIN